jgi:hypothetical protein
VAFVKDVIVISPANVKAGIAYQRLDEVACLGEECRSSREPESPCFAAHWRSKLAIDVSSTSFEVRRDVGE